MSDEKLRNELTNLERKVLLLLSEHSKVKDQVSSFQRENEDLKRRIAGQQQELSSFQNNYKITKIVDSMTAGGDDSRELKEVLNNYIKEIDKCIAHLGEA